MSTQTVGKLVITPWKWFSDLRDVRGWFYPSSNDGPDMRHEAIDRVSVWKRRGHLPHEVHSTALLMDAVLHDSPEVNSEFSIRATYSAAFCRFVTGLVDSPVHGKRESMYEKAKRIGMPASFVEIRHYATHGDLPTLSLLRGIVQRSLGWLWDHWWVDIESRYGKGLEYPDPDLSNISELKARFRTHLRPGLKMKRVNATRTGKKPSQKSGAVWSDSYQERLELIKICKDKPLILRVLAQVLLEDDYIIPPKKEVGQDISDQFEFWGPFLRSLSIHQRGFLCQLSNEMVLSLAQPSNLDVKIDSYRNSLYMWLRHIYTSQEWLKSRNRGGVPNTIIETCIMNPGYWTDKLAICLMEEADEAARDRWSHIILATSKDHQQRVMRQSRIEMAKIAGDPSGGLTEAELADEEMWKELAEFGWTRPDTDWAPRPLGM